MMMDACIENDVYSEEADSEEDITVNMPLEVLHLGLVNPVEELYPAHYEPPVRRFLKSYIAECRQRARELREHERIQYADALYYRCRRLCLRIFAHMKKNATARPWEDYDKKFYSDVG